ncbi:MAG: binding-protein-dependent transport system inner rane component [Paenibacillaceae bacterium]|jgi:putative aldouronate transport system permease protein|nr:binding-protein-dependent transport system inner rane component [Paenibacillaceae bacterium]
MTTVKRWQWFSVFNYSLFVLLGILMLYPFWYVLMYSFNDPIAPSSTGLNLYPRVFSLDTYKYVLNQKFLYVGFTNSIIVTVGGTLISMLLTIGCAYPLSKAQLKGRRLFFSVIFFTMLFSGGLIPTYILVSKLNMVNTLWALMVPGAVVVYFLIIMIKFFKGIPEELIESAKIDGANDMYILFRIALPLSKAVLAAVGLMYAVMRWNEYLPGIIYINDSKKYVLQVILNGMLNEETLASSGGASSITSPESVKMAAVILTILPIVMIYPFLQKYFVKGMLIGAVKG